MSMALAGFSAATSIVGGFAQSAAMKSEAKSLEFQAKAEKLRGKQISAARRAELNETLSAIDTLRVDRGLALDSVGGMNIRRANRKRSRTNENAEVLTSKFRETDLKTKAASRRRAAPFAILAGFGQAASTVGGALSDAKALRNGG